MVAKPLLEPFVNSWAFKTKGKIWKEVFRKSSALSQNGLGQLSVELPAIVLHAGGMRHGNEQSDLVIPSTTFGPSIRRLSRNLLRMALADFCK